MLSLILAAALAASTPTHIPLQHVTPLSEQTLQGVETICLSIALQKATPQEVIDRLHLTTQEEQQQLVDYCMVYLRGVQDGVTAAQQPQEHNGINPEALRIR